MDISTRDYLSLNSVMFLEFAVWGAETSATPASP